MPSVDIDWKVIEEHYAQYSPRELMQMCQPHRCRTCNEASQCNSALAKSRQSFMRSLYHDGEEN